MGEYKQQILDEALKQMEKQMDEAFETVTIEPNQNTSATLSQYKPVVVTGSMTFDAGKSWYTPTDYEIQKEYERRRDIFIKVKNKDIIDIGINANVACITFDDYSILEISPKFTWMTLHETTDLISLNGGKLHDIVMHIHNSLITDVFAQIQITSTWGNSVVIEITSPRATTPSNHFIDFTYIEQPTNAVRKQTQTI